jgi:hypothetical protein
MGFVWWAVFLIVPFFILCFVAGMVSGIMHPGDREAGGAAGRIIGETLGLPLFFISFVLSVWLTTIGKLPGTRK